MFRRLIILIGFSLAIPILLALFSTKVYAVGEPPFIQAYSTLGNSRFSYKARVGSQTVPQNATNVKIVTSGQSDNDTNNLFIGDDVCFNNPDAATKDGCTGQTTYDVRTMYPSGDEFAVNTGIGTSLTIGTAVVATQSGRITITFKPTTQLNSGDFLRLVIPSETADYADGIPDDDGWDSGKLLANLLAGTSPQTAGSCASTACLSSSNFTISTGVLGYSSSAPAGHQVLIGVGSTLATNVQYSFVLGHSSDATLRFLNPAPTGASHVRGVSDSYSFTLRSENSSGSIRDLTVTKVNPVDGVFVSANVELTLSYTIAGRTSPVAGCASTSVQNTTATAVPFGSISSFDSFFNLSQVHSLTTNAYGGYILQAYEDGPLTTLSGSTIPDTTCDGGGCSTTASSPWTGPSYNGFGYSLQIVSGGTSPFQFNDSSRIFNARAFPAAASPVTIFSNTAPANGHSLNTCYRLSVDQTYATGLYYNKLTYIATPIFQ